MFNAVDLLKSVSSVPTKRSEQLQIGPSEIGLCRRKLWYRLKKQEKTNDVRYSIAAFMGTAIHKAIEERIKELDPDGQKYWTEIELHSDGLIADIKGHVDLYIPGEKTVVDWKTITKGRRKAFPSTAQRYQVHLYGSMLQEVGLDVEHVMLVGICRDGNEDDIVVHHERYNPLVTDAAYQWLSEAIADPDVPPSADQSPYRFCARYCVFYDKSGEVGCKGKE